MSKINRLFFLLLIWIVIPPCQAQIKEAINDIFSTGGDSVENFSVHRSDSDSIRFAEVERLLEESRTNEMNLRMEIEQIRMETFMSDSIKKAEQKHRIDSLRSVTKGVAVIINRDTLFRLYAKRGGLSPVERVKDLVNKLNTLGKEFNLRPDSVYIESTELVTDIMYKDKLLLTLTDMDGLWQNTTRDELARQYREIIVSELKELQKEHGLLKLLKRIFYFVLVIVVQYFLFRLTKYVYRRLKIRVIRLKRTKLKAISIQNYELLDTQRQVRVLLFLLTAGFYAIILIQLLISIPLLFSIFPQTESFARQIFSYLWMPVKAIFTGIIAYIPNLFTIIVICLAVKYLVRGVKYLSREIASERLKIAGFYPDWAHPTYLIIRFLLYAFMVAMIYPYLPGAEDGVFQGISVFVGLIVSLGSSTVIGNIIAGMVMTYMRAFHMGDRIKLNDIVGNVIEKTPLVTRVRTPKNELVTIPNSFVMSSHTVNYSASAREYGLIIHAEVSVGYEVPWRKAHGLLINAAKATEGVVDNPEPFVLETALNDDYCMYQINAYIRDADKLAQIYSNLYQSIQDVFTEANIELLSPRYVATRDGSELTVPKEKSE